jgi:oxygen-independent coproporphyrinogen-3 oxidase
MSEREPATVVGELSSETGVGSVFVSNYPPYSFWGGDRLDQALVALDEPADSDVPLGLYLHVPFCRKRCKFCYFKVYVDKKGADVQRYLDALGRECELYAARPAIAGRPVKFVYFGGGTPSFISTRHLRELTDRLRRAIPWKGAEEVTFECEPGTLTERKLQAIREVGVTRLSLGVEHFDDRILEENGRAHTSKEIYRVAPWIRALDFPCLNVDLIAGMAGESWETWRDTVQKAIDMDPDSVTIYQMELPFNTVYSQRALDGGGVPIADWATKRAWHEHAIERLQSAGYEISSAYTMVKRGKPLPFVYRDSVWHGCDLIGAGVSSFSHVGGTHYQNLSGWNPYLERLDAGELPVDRVYVTAPRERLIREMILQLKLGRLDRGYFRRKFGAEIVDEFAEAFGRLERRGMLQLGDDEVRLTRQGLLQVDGLLPEFYEEQHRNARYT